MLWMQCVSTYFPIKRQKETKRDNGLSLLTKRRCLFSYYKVRPVYFQVKLKNNLFDLSNHVPAN